MAVLWKDYMWEEYKLSETDIEEYELDVEFGAFLMELRKSAGMTQTELAEASGISFHRITDIEDGDDFGVTHKECRQIAWALGVDYDCLVMAAKGELIIQ